jgi:putative ABC transport system permease protein
MSRTGVATTALAIAIATVNGVGLMITSFRSSLSDWLTTTLTADLYITADDPGMLSDDQLVDQLAALAGVKSTSRVRSIIAPTELGELGVRAFRPGERGWGVRIVDGDETAAIEGVAAGGGLLASERLMLARNLRVGDEIALPAYGQEIRMPILGAFRDFNTGTYGVLLALETYQRLWRDNGLNGVGLDLDGSQTSGDVEIAARKLVGSAVRIRSSESIERLSLEIFDRTFRITEVLRLLAGVVAFLGVFSALLAVELERGREIAVLRAVGFLPRQLSSLLLAQTGLLGLAAGVIAMPIGVALAGLLVHVINRRAFGWTMELVIAGRDMSVGLGLALGAALLAGVYPAWRASRQDLAAALREE